VPLIVDLTCALIAAVTSLALLRLFSHRSSGRAQPSLEPARTLGEAARSRAWLRRLLLTRFNRETEAGLLIAGALLFSLASGIVIGVLAYVIRTVPAVQRVDTSVADWGYRNRTGSSTSGLHALTELGSARVVVAIALVLLATDLLRTRSRWAAPFLAAVLVGNEVLTVAVKDVADRVRPALVPVAATLGPSFPSGHSSTSASFYAAAALILGRRARRPTRQLLAAAAICTAVAVAASRVLLDLHWLTDVIGGLALGWGWFALCAAVFGGRLLRPTAAVDTARSSATGPPLKQP
jgi:membrane-associated phospholipid phosphatase